MLCHIYPYGAYTQAFQSVNVSYVGKVYLDLSSFRIQQGVLARCLPTETFGSETHATRKRLVHYKHLYHPTWLACYIGAALWLMNEQPECYSGAWQSRTGATVAAGRQDRNSAGYTYNTTERQIQVSFVHC